MAMTDQEQALRKVRTQYGEKSAFTHHHLNYCQVGCEVENRMVVARGSTWDEAISLLERKVALLERKMSA